MENKKFIEKAEAKIFYSICLCILPQIDYMN